MLITGGTSRLGSALVRRACELGASVFFTFHSAKDAAAKLVLEGAEGFQADLSDTVSMDAFLKQFHLRTDRLHTLVHNAAATRDVLLRDMTEADWDYVIDVGLKAPFYLTRGLLPALKKAQPGKIFMITSRAALVGTAGLTNYSSAKAGVIALAKSLAQELGPDNILVNAVNPGFMESRMTENLSEEVLERNRDASPLKRFSNPEEVARLICSLASDDNTQLTGQVFSLESRNTPW